MSTDSANIDVNELMRQIQERARQSTEALRPASNGANPLAGPSELTRLRFSAAELREAIRRVNELPPSPPTLRGRMGLILIKVMSRLMAWQSGQVRPFRGAVVNNSDEQLRVIEALLHRVEEQEKTIESLSRGLAALRLSAWQEQQRIAGMLAEETQREREFEAGCQSSLHRLEHEILRRHS